MEDIAQFTPKNIEIKSDQITQVFATKVRILDQLERLKPGYGRNRVLERRASDRAA